MTYPKSRDYILVDTESMYMRNGWLVEVSRVRGGWVVHDCNACEVDTDQRVGARTTKANLMAAMPFDEAIRHAKGKVAAHVAAGWTFLRSEDRGTWDGTEEAAPTDNGTIYLIRGEIRLPSTAGFLHPK